MKSQKIEFKNYYFDFYFTDLGHILEPENEKLAQRINELLDLEELKEDKLSNEDLELLRKVRNYIRTSETAEKQLEKLRENFSNWLVENEEGLWDNGYLYIQKVIIKNPKTEERKIIYIEADTKGNVTISLENYKEVV